MVYGTTEARHSLSSVQQLLIDTPSGGHVRLKDVAAVRLVPGVTAITRDAVARCMDVTANVRGRDLAAVAADVERGIQRIDFPLEYRAELLGEYAERLAIQQRVVAFAVAAAFGILLLLQASFRSWRLATLVFLTLPVALLGGVLAAFLTSRGLLSFGSIVGFFALFGIAVRNAVTLLDRCRRLEQEEGVPFGPELVRRATEERAGPVLLGAIATALAFGPFALAGNIAGLELIQPMAVVVLGGLVTTTLLSLVGMPALYLLFGAIHEPDLGLAEEFPATAVTE
jgi:Cu/Ag efflux pump CusA